MHNVKWNIAIIELYEGYTYAYKTLDNREDFNTFCENHGYKLISFEVEE